MSKSSVSEKLAGGGFRPGWRSAVAAAVMCVLVPVLAVGARAQDGPVGGGSGAGVGALSRLAGEQEALMNAYRCLFAVDVEVVPGGCDGGRPAAQPFAGDEAEGAGELVDCSGSEYCLVSFSGRGGSRWCGLLEDRTVICTNHQGSGPLAAGPNGPPEGEFLSVSAGLFYACGLREDRSAVCWDYRWSPWDSHNHPTPTGPPAGRFLSVSAGIAFQEFACGLRADRTVVCWGDDVLGTQRERLEAPEGRFLSVSAGWEHACGISEDRTVVCWGDNKHGRLEAPEGRFLSVSAGFWFSCGIREDRTATCWGNNLKRGYNAPGGRFLSVSAGQGLACGVREDRTAVCWGPPGLGGISYHILGELDPPSGEFASVAAGPFTSCGLRPDGALECWGRYAMAWDSASFAGRPAIQAVYAVPAGEAPVEGREQLIADAVAEVQAWFRSQTGGRHLRFRQDANRLSVVTVELSDRGDDDQKWQPAVADIYRSLGSRPPLLVFGEGDFPVTGNAYACANAGSMFAMISLGRCLERYSGELARVVAHELVHLLGAVPYCAPHTFGDGHVTDDAHDIMSRLTPTERRLSQTVLDEGRDDYYGHGRDDCYDISDNPLLVFPG